MSIKERDISRRLVLSAMGDEQVTRAQLMERTGMHENTLYRILKHLRADKMVRITGWINRTHEISGERLPGQPYAVYGLNPDGLPDAPYNKRIPAKKVRAKWHINRRVVLRARELAKSGDSNMFDQLRYAA